MIEFLLVVWFSVVLFIFAWVLDDIQRLKQLQATLEGFIHDVQE